VQQVFTLASLNGGQHVPYTIDITEPANLQVIEPAILYLGTPVVLIGSSNEDGSPNLAPMSSAWWVGWRCMLGLASNSKSTENMIRTGECVLSNSTA
jgi:flavin reductase (DIM6/NTAB) family NADH-FMN oxidoreductase RutF